MRRHEACRGEFQCSNAIWPSFAQASANKEFYPKNENKLSHRKKAELVINDLKKEETAESRRTNALIRLDKKNKEKM